MDNIFGRYTSDAGGAEPHDGDPRDGGPLRRRRPGPRPRITPQSCLVVGWDRHPDSLAAARFAAALAVPLRAHIHIVHIVDLDDEPIDPDAPDWEEQYRANVTAEAVTARALLDDVPASWTYHSGHGSPADLLAQVADRYGALMVVVGSPRSGLMGYLDSVLGQSVAHRLIGARRVPLLLVPADTQVGDGDVPE
ncbi:universal stress protein [Gordonia sp. NB41Y]|nr:universal stress protein [Gordonia sp. NB41Y]WLP89893.1 universal stress protein [Gordonia sp. NB41Y]